MNTITNRRGISLLVLLPCILLLTHSICFSRELNIPCIRQEETKWCWAACSQMVLRYYGISKSQTSLAEWVFVIKENTALPLYNSMINSRLGVNKVLDNYAGWAVIGNQNWIEGALGKGDIFYKINNNRPILILGSEPPGYHIVAIIGYIDNNPTNPTIIINDPINDNSGGRIETTLTYIYKTTSIDWEWLETLRFQRSGSNGVGIFDGVQISNSNVSFDYYEPAVSRTYSGNFIRAIGSYANVSQWNWSLTFSYNGGDYTVNASSYPEHLSLSTTWYVPAFNLPMYYAWNFDSDGAITGILKLTCLDSDGIYHTDYENIRYYPPNPYPMSIVLALTNMSGSLPEFKTHQLIKLYDCIITNNASTTFRTGESIIIGNNVTIQNGALANFIIDPSIR